MPNVRPLTRAIRILTAVCGVIAFLGAYTIAFAQEARLQGAEITHSNIAFGSQQ
jgi:hypothetical protein